MFLNIGFMRYWEHNARLNGSNSQFTPAPLVGEAISLPYR